MIALALADAVDDPLVNVYLKRMSSMNFVYLRTSQNGKAVFNAFSILIECLFERALRADVAAQWLSTRLLN